MPQISRRDLLVKSIKNLEKHWVVRSLSRPKVPGFPLLDDFIFFLNTSKAIHGLFQDL